MLVPRGQIPDLLLILLRRPLARQHSIPTPQMAGRVNRIDVLVLIGSGATYSVNTSNLITSVGMTLAKTKKGIQLGDGCWLFTKGIWKDINSQLHTRKFTVDAFFVETWRLAFNFGSLFAGALGKAIIDREELSMQFVLKGKKTSLTGGANC